MNYIKHLKPQALSFLLVLFLFIISHCAVSQCWDEVWADEFDGTSLDGTKWNYDLGNGCPGLCGWGNNEKEYYTSNADNISVSGGNLSITVKYDPDYLGSGADFTSAKIHTRNKFDWLYGKFEARMKLPQGTGLWPAFWMLPTANTYGGWPTSGEIDIMENRGDQITTTGGTLHYGNSSPDNQWDGTDYVLSSGDFVNSFHVFSVEWEPGEIRWYVDGILYKTERESPPTLNPASNNATAWPWDQNFFMIMNLAVGGWYSGNPSTATIIGGDVNYSRTMEIDYVRVYSDLSAGGFSGSISGKSSILQNESNVTYTIPATGGATYNWSVTGSSSITTGQGSNTITVDFGTSDDTVSVDKTLGCGTGNFNLPVTVQPTHCGIVVEDFENIRYPDYGYLNGVFTEKIANPSISSENTSPFCARYIRNSFETWDVIIWDNFAPGDADDFEKRIKRIFMDVYSNSAGRKIEIGLENSSIATPVNYPLGRHSLYRATTTAVNAWETLEFEYVNSPDPALSGTTVDKLVFLFEPNTNSGATYYIDNFLISHKPNTSDISGPDGVCENQTGVNYSVTNTTGSDYVWTVPAGATIASGGSGPNNNSITVNFSVNPGDVSVTETNTTGCSGAAVDNAVTISPKPVTSVISGAANVCNNETGLTYSVTNTTGSDYSWTVPAGATITSGGTGPDNNLITVNFGVNSGNVSVTEIISGCAGDPVSLAVTAAGSCLGVHKASDQSIGIYPNPGNNFITLKLNNQSLKGDIRIAVIDKLGRIVKNYEMKNNSNEVVVDIDNLPADLYFIKVINDDFITTGSFFKN